MSNNLCKRSNIKVPFKFPSIIESGVNIKPNERFFIDFDYRFYRYGKALDTINVLDKQSGTILAAQNLNARDVHLFLIGGAYNLTEKSKLLYGAGLTTNALNDASFNPGLNNSGGISVSGGYARRISGVWLNFGATGIFALNRTINAAPQVFFPGDYKSRGIIFGIGIRR